MTLTRFWVAAMIAATLVFTPSCLSESGGAPFSGQVEFNGEGIAAYDLNTLVVVGDAAISARLIDINTGLPYWVPLVDHGAHVWIRIRDRDGERWEGKFDWLPEPEVTHLPADLALYGRVLTSIQQAQYRIAFDAE